MPMLQQILRLDGYIQDIYLAVYADKILLLDGCCRSDVSLIIDTIKNILGRDITELQAVIVTHMHPDHAGAAPFLRELTGCKIISNEQARHWYAGVSGLFSYCADLSLAHFVAHRQGKKFVKMQYPRLLTPDYVVKDGDCVPLFEDWQVIDTPGHTDGDFSLLHSQTGKMYIGDLMILLNKKKFVHPYVIYDPAMHKDSLIRLKSVTPNFVMMAHGGQTRYSNNALDTLIASAPTEPRNYKAIANQFKGHLFGGVRKVIS